jgi:hypothetical protein
MIVGIGGLSITCPRQAIGVWTPAKITTALWLDANDSGTIALNGSTVSQWSDKSGNNRHATQAVGANQPGYSATAFNSKPALTWPVVTPATTVNVWLDTPAFSAADGSRRFASFLVGRLQTGLADVRRMMQSRTDFQYYYLGMNSGAATLAFIAGVAALPSNFISSAAINSPFLATILFGTDEVSSNQHRLTLNGGAVGPADNSGNTGALNTGGFRIGANIPLGDYSWGGEICEVIHIAGTITAADREKVEGYLAWKWGLESNLPMGHPYKNARP